MGALGVIELEGAGEGLEDAVGDAGRVAAFELGVIGDADAGERGDLLAAQPGNATRASAEGAEARLCGRDPAAPGGEELLDLPLCVHQPKVAPLAGLRGVRPVTPWRGPSNRVRPCNRGMHGMWLPLRMLGVVMYTANEVRVEDVPDGYRAMNDREVLKFQIKH